MAEKRQALGRGLSALIPDTPVPARESGLLEVDLDLLDPNRFQPRLQIDEARLDELAQSIRANGVIQPILVRRVNSRYEIIAGERRWRAAQRAGLLKVPVVLRDVPDERLLQVALIENIQRENLNPIDEALAYHRLIREFHLTQDAVADAVGKDRSSVANYLRLLNLAEQTKALVAGGALTMGHARALLGLEDPERQVAAAHDAVKRALSVRDTESLVRRLAHPRASKGPAERPQPDVHTRQAEEKMRLSLGTRVRIVRKGRSGRIEIDFASEDELHRLYERLLRP
jgi:ParB family transcriptional regulator, chromosome partitioning protein